MSDTLQIILGFCFLVAVFILTRLGVSWKTSRTADYIIGDLESKGAVDPITAVELPYSKPALWRIGMRDYHSKTLEYLVTEGAVGKTAGGKYFLAAKRR